MLTLVISGNWGWMWLLLPFLKSNPFSPDSLPSPTHYPLSPGFLQQPPNCSLCSWSCQFTHHIESRAIFFKCISGYYGDKITNWYQLLAPSMKPNPRDSQEAKMSLMNPNTYCKNRLYACLLVGSPKLVRSINYIIRNDNALHRDIYSCFGL